MLLCSAMYIDLFWKQNLCAYSLICLRSKIRAGLWNRILISILVDVVAL